MSSFVHFCADQSNGTVSGAIWRTVGSLNTKAAPGAAGSRNAVRARPRQPARANQAAGVPVALRLFAGNAFKLAPTPAPRGPPRDHDPVSLHRTRWPRYRLGWGE